MTSGLTFLLAAKRCEIAVLQQLSQTSALVRLTARLVHALQRERGLSNVYLGSQGARFSDERIEQIGECQGIETELRRCFEALDTSAQQLGHGARLFSRIAYVLHGLDALPALRQQVDGLHWSARQATEAYVRLVAGLLAVVFEAADSASDPAVSRLLVALFNFMQGKEFAGQERAAGSLMFAAGRADAAEQQRLLLLIESQERCLALFESFSNADVSALWQASQAKAPLADLERMRRILCTAPADAPLVPAQSAVWFDCCSLRIDHMKAVEERLTDELLRSCEDQMTRASRDLHAFEALCQQAPAQADALAFFQSAPAPVTPAANSTALGGMGLAGYGQQLERSILELVQEQAGRLQAMGEELDSVRASLNERRLIERAKGLLMAHRQLSEEEAHKTLRQLAMNQNRRLFEVAESVLAMAEVLPAPPR
jgi:AmiR/NasT family two-component response regulator